MLCVFVRGGCTCMFLFLEKLLLCVFVCGDVAHV